MFLALAAPEVALLRMMPGAQLNWLGRYLPLRHHLGTAAARSLLDVGSGSVGAGCILPGTFVGLDVAFPEQKAPGIIRVRSGGGPLPFADGAFHTVVCLDTLEHVPAGERAALIAELVRVSALQVLVGCPSGVAGEGTDALLEIAYGRLGMPIPTWAREHVEHGLPTSRELEHAMGALSGISVEQVRVPGALMSALLPLADAFPEIQPFAAATLGGDLEAVGRWLDAAAFGPYARLVYRIRRERPLAPLFDSEAADTLGAALRCHRCGGSHRRVEAGLACAGCGSVVRNDGAGIWRVDEATAFGALLPMPTTFAYVPDWLGSLEWVSVVLHYLQAFPPEAPCKLWLHAPSDVIRRDEMMSVLQPVLARMGSRTFAELYVEEAADGRPTGPRVIRIERSDAARWSIRAFREAAGSEVAS